MKKSKYRFQRIPRFYGEFDDCSKWLNAIMTNNPDGPKPDNNPRGKRPLFNRMAIYDHGRNGGYSSNPIPTNHTP